VTQPTTASTFPSAARQSTPDYQSGIRQSPPRARGGRVGAVVLMIVSLVAAGVMRHLAVGAQQSHSPAARRTTSAGGGASLAGMDSYALALLLGGLRGPLVMILWAQSESQKSERNLEGIDTQIEWIRRLQPEFDTVHIFQMWNKAYNISVQMVGLSNKYTVILDALDYGRSVDAERPDNLNILREIGRIYGDKLANSNPEKYYYRDRLMRETRYREQKAGPGAGGAQRGLQRLAHEPLLDENGNLLRQYLQPRFPGEKYDGSELQFLERYQPFPYGLSPSAMGYNYHKRSQLLMELQKQKPLQVSTAVADSAPALSLKQWSEDEWERGRRLELRATGTRLSTDRIQFELPTAELPLDTSLKDPSVLPEILYCYANSARLVGDALVEYKRHLDNPEFATKLTTYLSHTDTLIANRSLVSGDHDYLKAIQVGRDDPQYGKLLASAARHYHNSVREFGLVALRYYTADNIAEKVLPQGVSRATLGTGPPGSKTAVTEQDVRHMMEAVRAEITRLGGLDYDPNGEDRAEYDTYIARADARLKLIEQAGQKATTSPGTTTTTR
jgi:hypothetical protein